MIDSKLVLLIEDETPKRGHIVRYLASFQDELTVVVAMSVTSALDEIEKSVPDVVLLDMSLPTFDVGEKEPGGRPQGFGGVEILRHMVMSGIVAPTVVITGYEALPRGDNESVTVEQMRAEFAAEFPDHFRGVLQFNSSYDEWKVDLKRELVNLGILRGADK
jgi:CheY-like chemotaxis protein